MTASVRPAPTLLPNPLYLLLVEDSETDAELLVLELRRQGFTSAPTRVQTEKALRTALADGEWDVIISDHNMPGFSGREALRIALEVVPHVPFIVVSGSLGEEHAVEAMRAGASDFIVKTRLDRLAGSVERALREAEHRAHERRTATALAEAQQHLRQSQKLEALGQLAGGIAHDFNNLLTAILGFADLVLGNLPRDSEHRADIEEIRHAGLRAADLTHQLLAFSRQQVLDQSTLDLAEVVDDVVRLLDRVIGEEIGLLVNHTAGLWPVRADRTQMSQIVLNLCVNARDAMPRGGALTIDLSNVVVSHEGELRRPPVPGRYVCLEVRDAGEGIPLDVLPKIFDPFFTTKEPGKGTGLGLATVYGIVQQSGGSIFVESEVGHGTVFSVYLPESAEAMEHDAARAAGGEKPAVLVVEEDASLRELAVQVLTDAGYDVMAAASVAAAREIATGLTAPIDLLLTDLVSPGLGGLALAQELRTAQPDLRVVFMSGFSTTLVSALQQFRRGDMLVKPFTPHDLLAKIRTSLARRVS